jgi:hypothetical protein
VKSIIGNRRAISRPSSCSSGRPSSRCTRADSRKYSSGLLLKNRTPCGTKIGSPAAALSSFHCGRLSNAMRV